MNYEHPPLALVLSSTLSVGQRLRRERQRLGWSQAHLAQMLRTSAVSVSRWERDVVLPHPHLREQLAQLFHNSVETLFPLSEPAEDAPCVTLKQQLGKSHIGTAEFGSDYYHLLEREKSAT